jgi:AcrR family transcriptional regulator
METRGSIWMRPQRHSRGPDPAYSREQITAAAIKIADAEGLDAVSMRRIAREVNAGAMSLYRYLGSKDDLIELMIDAVQGEEPPPEPTGDWRADLTVLAERMRTTMRRHPWLTQLTTAGRPTFGPNTLRLTEHSLRCVDGLGLSIDEMLSTVLGVASLVRGVVQGELAEDEARRRTKLTEEQWRATQVPYLRKIMDSGEFPLVTKVILDARIPHLDPEEQFRTSLDHLLDGIAARLAQQGKLG